MASLKILKLLKEAGCFQIYFGVETGDEQLRARVLSRYMSNDQIVEAFKNCRKLGIATLAYNIVGLPNETPSKVIKTIKLNAKINPGAMIVNIFTPYPHTKLYDICVEQNLINPIHNSAGREKLGKERILNKINSSKIDYRDEIFIEQPRFSKKEVLFLSLYFEFFVRLYHYTQKISFLWPILDRIILGKYLPKRILIILMKIWESANNQLKNFVRKNAVFFICLSETVLKSKKIDLFLNVSLE